MFLPSVIFFYCLFEGYLSIVNLKRYTVFVYNYKYINYIKYIFIVLIIVTVLYFSMWEVHAAGPEDGNIPPKATLNIKENQNTLSIKDSVINIPDAVAKGLTNLGTGAAVAAGLKAGATAAKTAGLTPSTKLSIIGAGAVLGGATVVTCNAINSMIHKKNNSGTNTPPKTNTGGDGGQNAFSIEEGPDLNTIMVLLDANYILHLCIIYLSFALAILYFSHLLVENKWNLLFIKNTFGEWFYNLLIKSLRNLGKFNKIWLFITFVFLIFGVIVTLYISYFLVNNFDIISEIVKN